MLGLLFDPYLFDLDERSQTSVAQFVGRLLSWSDALSKYEIRLLISQQYAEMLQARLSRLSRNGVLNDLADCKGWNAEEITVSCEFILSQLRSIQPLDSLMVELGACVNWGVDYTSLVIQPEQIVQRIPSEDLKWIFKDTLSKVVLAAEKASLLFPNIGDGLIVSVFEGSPSWLEDWCYRLFARVHYYGREGESARESRFDLTLTHDFELIEGIASLAQRAPERETSTFRSVEDAVQAVVSEYPDRLVYPTAARRSASSISNMTQTKLVYDLIKGLAEVWFPVFDSAGQDRANSMFYQKFQYRCVNDESEPVRTNPNLRRDYEVEHDGQTISCFRHIKVGNGPHALRINFEVMDIDGKRKILIGRAGKHGRNQSRPH